jgi:hypothetical protein
MPLARIRSFDPEAIAFLAAQLAESGYTLQFVRPDETGLEEADLELTVLRRDLDEALRIAQTEAERLGVDVTVVPGVMPLAAPERVFVTPESTAPISEPAETADIARWTQIAKESSEKTAHVLGRGVGKAVDGLEVISDSLGRGLASSKDSLSELGDSTANRLNQWKARFRTARALRRGARQPETFRPNRVRPKSSRRPKPLWLRERIYKGAAIAAVVATAAIIGWTLAGYAGPANPVGKGTGISTVQEQVPFGPATANAAPVTATPSRASAKSVPKPKPDIKVSGRHRTSARSHVDDDQEIVVRHFNQKPSAEQARAKTHNGVRDGVKIISEE